MRAQNRALAEENRRLSDLTRMLLSSSSFSNFLHHLSTNPAAGPQPAQQIKLEQQPMGQAQIRKDVNPYAAQPQPQQQQIGMAMIPEQAMDMSMLSLDNQPAYHFQPTVFMASTPEVPVAIDASVLSGKLSSLVDDAFASDEDKVEVPAIEHPAELPAAREPAQAAPVDDEFESDPEFALFHAEPVAKASGAPEAVDADRPSSVDVFGGVEAEKALSCYVLVDATEGEASAVFAMARVQRISASLESVVSRLELLTMDL